MNSSTQLETKRSVAKDQIDSSTQSKTKRSVAKDHDELKHASGDQAKLGTDIGRQVSKDGRIDLNVACILIDDSPTTKLAWLSLRS